jgi:hypothetical protein
MDPRHHTDKVEKVQMKHPPLWNTVVYFVAACVVGILLVISIIILLRGWIMSDEALIALFASLPPTIAAVGALIVALKTRKDVNTDIQSVKRLVDFRTDEMVRMSRGMSERVMAREESESTDDDPMWRPLTCVVEYLTRGGAVAARKAHNLEVVGSIPTPATISGFGAVAARVVGIMERETFYWLAGLLEGEGSFMSGPPSAPNAPRIHIAMTDEDVIAKVAQLWGVKYLKAGGERTRLHGWKPVFGVTLTGKRSIELMLNLRPLMGKRRQ